MGRYVLTEEKAKITRRKYLMYGGGIVVVAVVAAAGYGVYEATKPPTPTPLTELIIGVQGPMTGPNAYAGRDFKNAAILALEERGGKISGIPVRLVYIDCESDPEKGVKAYEKAILVDKIHLGMIGWHSSVHLALLEVWAANKFPHFCHYGAAKTILEKIHSNPDYYKWSVAKWWPVPEKLVIGYVDTIFKAIEKGIIVPKTKTFSIYIEDTDWGRSFGESLGAAFEEKGWKRVSFDVGPLDETDHVTMLTKIKGLNPDVIGITFTGAAAVTSLIKQAREVGLRSILICDGVGWVAGWYEMAGKASDYVLDMIPGWASPKAKDFVKRFKEKFGYEPSPSTAGLAYDAARFTFAIVEEVLKRTGGVWDKELGVEIGRDFAFKEGVLMECYQEDPNDRPDLIVGEHYYIFPVLQYFDGKGVVVWPSAWAEADFTRPPWFG